jgi:hypothetical protein
MVAFVSILALPHAGTQVGPLTSTHLGFAWTRDNVHVMFRRVKGASIALRLRTPGVQLMRSIISSIPNENT